MIDWLLCVVVKSIGWCLCRVPPEACVWIGTRLGRLGYWLQPKRRRIGYLNLKAAFGQRLPAALSQGQSDAAQAGLTPKQARRILHQLFGDLGAGVVEMLRLPAMDRVYFERYITVEGRAHIDAAVASGRPVMFLTAHFGNWELNSIVAAFLGCPIVALARAQDKFPRLYRLLVSYRESKGCRVVHKGVELRQLLRAMEHQAVVGIVGDQASRQGVFVELFGRPALFATGPFGLARHTHAVILPAFIHRVRGPFHRVVVEPPLVLPTEGSEEETVRHGAEQFAQRLTRHVEQDPGQWLWAHKRWKYTPVRRVMVLSDGKLGHLKQSLVVVHAMNAHGDRVGTIPAGDRAGAILSGEEVPPVAGPAAEGVSAAAGLPTVREDVVEVRYRNRLCRGIALLWAWGMPRTWGRLACLRWTLERSCARRLASSYADVVISCGASTAAINLLVSAETNAKSVVIMNPTPLPLRRFALAFVPMHDALPPRPNVIQTYGALSAVNGQGMHSAAERLRARPNFRSSSSGKMVAVLLGGETRDAHFTTSFVEALIGQVLLACEEADAQCLVTTSRRTPPDVERFVAERLAAHPRCACLVLASRDPLEDTVDGMLGLSQVLVVTGESVSMVTEACASGRAVIIVDPPTRRSADGRLTKPQRYVRLLVDEGYAAHHVIPEVGRAVRRSLTQPRPVRRLNPYDVVRDAMQRLV